MLLLRAALVGVAVGVVAITVDLDATDSDGDTITLSLSSKTRSDSSGLSPNSNSRLDRARATDADIKQTGILLAGSRQVVLALQGGGPRQAADQGVHGAVEGGAAEGGPLTSSSQPFGEEPGEVLTDVFECFCLLRGQGDRGVQNPMKVPIPGDRPQATSPCSCNFDSKLSRKTT